MTLKTCGILFLLASGAPGHATPPTCDVNHDGAVNIVDIQLEINQALGRAPCTSDLDSNGTCDVVDVQRVITAALTGQCNADVTNGLIGYWKLDEASGTVAHDSSGLGYDGTVTAASGTYAWRPTGGRINGAFVNLSSSAPITVQNNSQINFSGDFTFALWVKLSTSDHAPLLWKSVRPISQGTAFQGYGLGMISGHLQAFLDGRNQVGTLAIPIGQWAHLAMVKSGLSLILYVNGVADVPMSAPATITPSDAPLIFGTTNDDVRVYNRALTALEIQAIAASNGSYVGATQVAPPEITVFAANPTSIAAGQSATLSWQVSGASTILIDNGIGSQSSVSSGSVTVSPTTSTTYTLTALNSGGSTALTATVVVAHPTDPPSKNVVITAPLSNATLSGTTTLAATVTGLPTAVAIEYYLNGRPLYTDERVGPIANPFTYSWNTFNSWDSFSQLTAVALDASRNVLATSAPIPVQIANTPYTLKQTSPDPSQTLTGTITWTVAANLPSGSVIWCYVDGMQVGGGAPPVISFPFDTTTLPNGQHEFHCMGATANPTNGYNLAALMSNYQMNVDNGRTLMSLRSNFGRLYLTPQESQSLIGRLVYTNGDEAGTSAVFTSDNPSVVTVSGSTATAVAPGTAHITAISQGKSAIVYVTVNASSGLPHFSKSGEILTAYDPANSLFVRTIFSGPFSAEFGDVPELASYLHTAGVNTLSTGFYQNPADNANWVLGNYSGQQSLSDYEHGFDVGYITWPGSVHQIAKANNWSMYLTGDDMARMVKEMIDSTEDPYSAAKIQYALATIKKTGNVIGISMIDECDGAWGGDPLAQTPGYWAKWSPTFTSSPFAALLKTMNAVSRPYIAWPTIGIGNHETIANWQGDPAVADYTDLYWDHDGIIVYPDGQSNWSIAGDVSTVLKQNNFSVGLGMMPKVEVALPVIQRNKPVLILVGASGNWYHAGVSRPTTDPYEAGVDQLIRPGYRPEQIPMEVFMAIARGAAGVRTYQFNHLDKYWPSTLVKGSEWQSGIGPFNQNGIDGLAPGSRWNSLGSAFTLVQNLEPYVLSPMTQAIDLGPFIVTGAHSGPSGNMLIAVNVLEAPQTIQADLSSYTTGASVTRYRLLADQVASESLGSVTSDQVTLSPGEVAVYVFPSGGASSSSAQP